MRNSSCALSDYKFYFFFTLIVHFGDALIVLPAKTPLTDDHGEESDAYLGVKPCLKQAVNPVL